MLQSFSQHRCLSPISSTGSYSGQEQTLSNIDKSISFLSEDIKQMAKENAEQMKKIIECIERNNEVISVNAEQMKKMVECITRKDEQVAQLLAKMQDMQKKPIL